MPSERSFSVTKQVFTDLRKAHKDKFDAKSQAHLSRLSTVLLQNTVERNIQKPETDGDEKRQQQRERLGHQVEQLLGRARKLHDDADHAKRHLDYMVPSQVNKTSAQIKKIVAEWEKLFGTGDEKQGLLFLIAENAEEQAQKLKQQQEGERRAETEKKEKKHKRQMKKLREQRLLQEKERQEMLQQERARRDQERQARDRQREIEERRARRRYYWLCQARISEHAHFRWHDRGLLTEAISLPDFIYMIVDEKVPNCEVHEIDQGMWELTAKLNKKCIVTFILNPTKTVIVTILRDDKMYNYKKSDRRYAPSGRCWGKSSRKNFAITR